MARFPRDAANPATSAGTVLFAINDRTTYKERV